MGQREESGTRVPRGTPRLPCRWTSSPTSPQLLPEPPATFCSQISETGEGQPRGSPPGQGAAGGGGGEGEERERKRRGAGSAGAPPPPGSDLLLAAAGERRRLREEAGAGLGRGGGCIAPRLHRSPAALPGSCPAPPAGWAALPPACWTRASAPTSEVGLCGGRRSGRCLPRLLSAPAGGKGACICSCAFRWQSSQKSTRGERREEIPSPGGVPSGAGAGRGAAARREPRQGSGAGGRGGVWAHGWAGLERASVRRGLEQGVFKGQRFKSSRRVSCNMPESRR